MDPEQIQTGEQLAGQLRELFHLGGWRIHRLAERAGLSKATVQGILSGTTMIPQAGTLTEFVRACGQDPARRERDGRGGGGGGPRLQQPVARATHADADHDGVSVPRSSTKPSFHQHRVPSAVNLGRRFMVECRCHGDDLYTAQQGLDLPIGQA
jgi:transcriptional regulator with XRE-family HTH domain